MRWVWHLVILVDNRSNVRSQSVDIKDEVANQQYIEQLKQDKTSNPKKAVDCSRWLDGE